MNETINGEVMTMTEIEKQHNGEWVLLEDPYENDRNQVAGGKLLFHSKNKDEVYQAAMRMCPKHGALLFMGPMPDDIFLNIPQIFSSNT